jgi:hypothetical protein
MQVVDWLASWPGAVWLQQSGTAYLFVNAAHILGVGLLVGAILPLDLMLMGALRSYPIAAVAPLLLRIATAGFVLAVATGIWLFTVQPRDYVDNPAFLSKLALLALALANIAMQHWGGQFQAALRGDSVAQSVRILAALSTVLWLSVLVAGRWIGFV